MFGGRTKRAALGLRLLLCLLPACGLSPRIFRTYPGAPRSRAELAVISQPTPKFFGGADAGIVRVDGVPIQSGAGLKAEIELEPGAHTIEADYYQAGSVSTTTVRLSFDAQAGRVYQVRAASVPRSPEQGLLQGRWTAWIVDLDTGAVVAGNPPQTETASGGS
jgi:hypothetical protein